MEESDRTEAEQLWDEIRVLIQQAEALNATTQRSRNLSLVITNLENAEDKMRRHIVEGK